MVANMGSKGAALPRRDQRSTKRVIGAGSSKLFYAQYSNWRP